MIFGKVPKGLISQTVVVLFHREVGLADLKPLLTEFNIAKEVVPAENWEFSGPSLTIEYLPEVNGLVSLDIVNRPWPDHMGNPKEEVTLFGAWSMGWFGPFTWPGGLERAVQQSWSWPEAKNLIPTHTSFVRLRMSYVFGADKEAKCLPENYAPLLELEFITSLASTLLRHPNALCYFDPNGEVLQSKTALDKAVAFAGTQNIPPMDVWTNVRLFNVNPTWLLMDTIGNWQLDIPDHEAAFPKDKFSPQEVSRWLRNVSLYVLQNAAIIKDGDTMDGPGNIRWQGKTFSSGVCSPPREVIRWLPTGVADIPPALLEDKKVEAKKAKEKPSKWRFW